MSPGWAAVDVTPVVDVVVVFPVVLLAVDVVEPVVAAVVEPVVADAVDADVVLPVVVVAVEPVVVEVGFGAAAVGISGAQATARTAAEARKKIFFMSY